MGPKRPIFVVVIFIYIASAYELVTVGFLAFFGSVKEVAIVGPLLGQEHWQDTVAPILILGVFAWILVGVFIHGLRANREQSAVNQVKGKTRVDSIDSPSANTAAGQRIHMLFSSQYNREAAREAIAADSAILYGAIEDRYGMTKVLVWILPVLGFIGTAWGMSHAIGGFSQALQETSDTAALTERLSQLVIPGLAHAFSVTILALSTAAIAHFCVSAVQTWQNDVLTELDQISLAWIDKFPADDKSGLDQETRQLLSHIAHQLAELVDGVKILGSAGCEITNAAKTLELAGQEVIQGGAALKNSVTLPYHIAITRGE